MPASARGCCAATSSCCCCSMRILPEGIDIRPCAAAWTSAVSRKPAQEHGGCVLLLLRNLLILQFRCSCQGQDPHTTCHVSDHSHAYCEASQSCEGHALSLLQVLSLGFNRREQAHTVFQSLEECRSSMQLSEPQAHLMKGLESLWHQRSLEVIVKPNVLLAHVL